MVTIDTGVLFAETLQTWLAFEERFGVEVDVEDAQAEATKETLGAGIVRRADATG